MNAVLWVGAALAGLWALHRLALWLESRGWLYYANTRHRGLEQDESGDDPPFKLGASD